ncbi:MAG TPA: response regulator, partial [Pyrinomonadaceae bacterium]|nr:response regulator [Pyrinomonadaceae bacterium]
KLVELVHQALENSSRENPQEASNNNNQIERGHAEAVVLFDPQAEMRTLVSHLLQRGSYHVEIAASESAALELAKRMPARIFLMHAADHSSGALVRRICSELPGLPIAAYSIVASSAERIEILGAGASYFIDTPEELLNLAETLSRFTITRQQEAA